MRDSLEEDFRNLQGWLERGLETGQFAACALFEEIGAGHGTYHMHLALIYTRNGRKTFSAIRSDFQRLGLLRTRPNIQQLVNFKKAVEYAKREDKRRTWDQLAGGEEPMFFFRDPASIAGDGSGGRRGCRTDIKMCLARYRTYTEAVLNEPDVIARGRHVAMDYYNAITARDHFTGKRTVIWLFGAPGTGKTSCAIRLAQQVLSGNYFVHMPGSLKWWDGYEHEDCAIIDDFRRDQVRECGGLVYLLRLTDRYDVRVEVKCGSTIFTSKLIIITSAFSPVAAFTYHREQGDDEIDENIGQLIRRLDYIAELRVLDGRAEEIDHTDRLKREHLINGGQFEPLRELRYARALVGRLGIMGQRDPADPTEGENDESRGGSVDGEADEPGRN